MTLNLRKVMTLNLRKVMTLNLRRSVRNCTSEQAAKAISKANKLEHDHLSKFTAIVTGTNCEDLLKSINSVINLQRDSLWLPIR